MTTADIKDVSMTYSSALEIAKAIDDKHLDFIGMRGTLDNLVDRLNGQWEGTAQREFLTAYNKLKPKLKLISETMERYSKEIRATVKAEQEADAGAATSFRGLDSWFGASIVSTSATSVGAVTSASHLNLPGRSGTLFDSVAYGVNAVISGAKQLVSNVKKSYDEHGWAYDVWEYGKCVLKGAKAVTKIVGGAVSIATGAGIPIGILSIISGVNDVCNVAADWTYLSMDAYDLVGTTNTLKDKLTENGGIIGEYLGNKELGELFGKLTYTGIDVVTFLDSTDKMLKSLGKVNTVVTNTTGYSQVWGKTTFEDVLENKLKFSLEPDYFIRKILQVDPASDGNIVYEAAKSVYKTITKAVGLGTKLSSI